VKNLNRFRELPASRAQVRPKAGAKDTRIAPKSVTRCVGP
jgi:hypothetical protein